MRYTNVNKGDFIGTVALKIKTKSRVVVNGVAERAETVCSSFDQLPLFVVIPPGALLSRATDVP